MPRVIECLDDRKASLAETCEALNQHGFDPQDEESLLHAVGWLRRLGNDDRFLGDILIAELAQRHREDLGENAYSPQVIMLAPPNGNYFIRANI